MKKIEAIIQPFKFDAVKEALKSVGIDGMTVSEVCGDAKERRSFYRGQEYNADPLARVKVEVVVADARLGEAVTVVTAAARSGKIGDGKVFVYDVADAIRIRNSDRGEAAL
jgi:nitrogen regulatory protein P-II 1